MTSVIQLVTAAAGSLFFSMLFNIRGNRLAPAAIGGAVSWGGYLIGMQFTDSNAVCIFIASVVLTIYAECFARILKTPATVFLVSSAVPLIPGGNLYQTMYYAVVKEYEAFSAMGMYTLSIALSIALGILCTTSCIRGWQKLKKSIF